MFAKNLKYYRLKSGFNKKELAEKVGLTPMAITNYEKGQRVPDMTILKSLANVLNVRVSDFLRQHNENLQFIHGEFRKNTKLSKNQQDFMKESVEDYISRFYTAVEILGGEILPECLNLHSLILTHDCESDALSLRRFLRLVDHGPVGSFVHCLENIGVLVYFIDIESKDFSGMNGTVNGRPYLVVNNMMSSERIRSTIVHELAHLAFNWENELDEKKNENYATSIAGAFLFPKSDALRELGVHRTRITPAMESICKEYGISMFMLAKRAYLCGIIDKNTEMEFYRCASMMGWRSHEPSRIVKEKPELFEQLVFRAVNESEITIQRGAELLNASFNYVAEHCSLY